MGVSFNRWMCGVGKELKRNKLLYIMLLPFIIWYIVFQYKPMGGLLMAFKDYDNVWIKASESDWVGFKNFIDFFSSPYFFRTLKNTLTISLSSIIFGFPAPIILALLLNELRQKKIMKFVQTVSYVPHFISSVVVCSMITMFLSPSTGVINIILEQFGLERQYFLINKHYFVPIFIIMGIWQSTGFDSIIYFSALTGVDTQLYDACVVDGGGRWRQLFTVTLPGILPTIIVMLIMRVGGILNVGYESIILLYQPATYETADVISTYVYRSGLIDGDYGYATAVGLLNSVVGFILVMGTNYLSQKTTEMGLW